MLFSLLLAFDDGVVEATSRLRFRLGGFMGDPSDIFTSFIESPNWAFYVDVSDDPNRRFESLTRLRPEMRLLVDVSGASFMTFSVKLSLVLETHSAR